MWKKICAIALAGMLVFIGTESFAQGSLTKENQVVLTAMEDSLVIAADSMYSAAFPEERLLRSERFARQLVRALKVENSWSYSFSKLGGKINIIYPEDKSFRIFNWAVAPADATRRYYGAIQLPAAQLKLYGLVDHSADLGKGVADSVLTGGRWMGCLYYRIIDKVVDGRKIYTLFGLNATNAQSNRKLLDALEITPTGPVFGAQIFGVRSETTPSQRVNRFILEYKKDVNISMNWDNDLNAIMFDRLVSQTNDPSRKYTFVPSGQYDGFRWTGTQWQMTQDLIPLLQLKDGEAPVGQPQ
jgi:hypothetical protein